jgi:hypothetical protein
MEKPVRLYKYKYTYIHTHTHLTLKTNPSGLLIGSFGDVFVLAGGTTKRILNLCFLSSCKMHFGESLFRRVRSISESDISFVMSVRPFVRLSAWNNSAPTGRIFTTFDI